MNFGTGDFSVTGWAKVSTNDESHPLFGHGNAGSNDGFLMGLDSVGFNVGILGMGSFTSSYTTAPAYIPGQWIQVCYARRGGTNYAYMNGVLEATWAGGLATTNFTTQWSNPITTLGKRAGTDSYMPNGSLALWRISGTAPTTEQVKDIYEAEKFLFQENAKCTLNGSSDAVTDVSYDDSTELLHIGTSGGRSSFKGLRRVEENTNAITELDAQGGIIVEQY